MPEEDQAMDIGNMPKKFGKASKNLVKLAHVVLEISLWIERHRQTYSSQYYATVATDKVIIITVAMRDPFSDS